MRNSKFFCTAVAAFALTLWAGTLSAQTSTVLTGNLNSPNKIITGAGNSLLVSEAGTAMPNTGRISLVDRTSGAKTALISGLPSAVSYLGGPAGDPDGPSGILLRGRTLYVTIGVGDAIVPGPGQGLESPNPGTPSSPLFDSVLEITLPGGYQQLTNGFVLTAANQAVLAAGGHVTLTNSSRAQLGIDLIANLPDSRPAPTPDFPNNVKSSHLYGVEMFQKDLYVVDSGHNNIRRVSLRDGSSSILVTFPSRPNPLPFGPPFVEAVPDSVHRVGNRLLVTLLTGFPFVPGLAEVRSVEIKSGENNGLIPNLTSAIDVLSGGGEDDATAGSNGAKTTASGDTDSYYTLEFSINQLAQAPGRLRYYSTPSAAPVDVLTTLITPTSMARDEDGSIYITSIATGTITKVTVQ